MRRLALILLLTLAALTLAAAPRPAAAAEPGDDITISVLTYGPGSHPFDKFGHQAIRVRNAAGDHDQVYNYGTYGFSSAAIIPKFVLGRFQYWLSRKGWSGATRPYIRKDRSIVEQELSLTPAQRLEIKQRLEENIKPENRRYKYDYYLDNCATRVRDVIDAVIGGRLREASRGPAPLTFRQHTQRLTADSPGFWMALNVVMGPLIDRPIDLWEEMFLPVKLEEGLRRATVPGPDGDRPLVKAERIIHASSRVPPPGAPPRWTARFAIAGVALGGALAALGAAGRTRRAARVAFGAALAFLGLVLGFFGSLFVFVWIFTDHAVGYRNENILQLAPFLLALAGYGVGVARGRARAARAAAALTAAAAAASLLGLLLKAIPAFSQDNAAFIAVCLPLWGGAALGARLLRRALAPAASPGPSADGAAAGASA